MCAQLNRYPSWRPLRCKPTDEIGRQATRSRISVVGLDQSKQQAAPGEKRHAQEFSVMEATLMKVFGVISTTAMFLLLGATIPAFAQEEHHEEAAKPAAHEETAKPAKQEESKPAKQQEAKPEKQESQAKPAKQEEQTKAKPEKQAEAKPAKQEKQAKPAKQEEQAKTDKPAKQAKPVKAEKQAKPAKQEEQAKSENQEGRGNTAGQHGQPTRSAEAQQRQRSEPALRLSARSTARIPDDRFRANFGAEHVFVINQPVIVGGFSRFQYGGFWFGFENPWPEGWYYTDNVYVDYIDGGYYLCNPYYPGARVGISVVL